MTLGRDLHASSRPTSALASSRVRKAPAKAESSRFEKLGIQVEDLTPQIAEQLGVKAEHGVAITDVQSGSPAEMAGLSTGMVITEANRQPVKSVDDVPQGTGQQAVGKGRAAAGAFGDGGQPVRGDSGGVRVGGPAR